MTKCLFMYTGQKLGPLTVSQLYIYSHKLFFQLHSLKICDSDPDMNIDLAVTGRPATKPKDCMYT